MPSSPCSTSAAGVGKARKVTFNEPGVQVGGSFSDNVCSPSVNVPEIDVVTGKPVEMGGSLGRREATGRGVMLCAKEALAHLGMPVKGATVAVQGFGNVGSVSADLLARAGAKIVAVSDWKGGVRNPKGLDIAKMLEFAKEHKTVDGFPGGDPLDGDAIFGLDVDITGIEGNIQLARYDSSDQGFYDWHTDFAGYRPLRKISISIQLSRSEDYDGGELVMSSVLQFTRLLEYSTA